MQHEGLFNRATAGTKRIVEKYHDTVSYALDFICDSQVSSGWQSSTLPSLSFPSPLFLLHIHPNTHALSQCILFTLLMTLLTTLLRSLLMDPPSFSPYDSSNDSPSFSPYDSLYDPPITPL